METKEVPNRNQRRWTNERHLHFLNSVEASFVRKMLQRKNNAAHSAPPMDRYLPDSSDSTLDLRPPPPPPPHSALDILDQRVRTDMRGTRLTHRQYTTCQDQVVPQLVETRKVDHKDEDEQPAFSFATTSATL